MGHTSNLSHCWWPSQSAVRPTSIHFSNCPFTLVDLQQRHYKNVSLLSPIRAGPPPSIPSPLSYRSQRKQQLFSLLQGSWAAASLRPRAKPAYPFVSLSIPLIWGVVLLLGLLVVAVVLFAVMARKKGR